ncbi:hypothetical protein J1605_016110 [Eschrichtius robustus]|uniref:Uncharacterized protein n=1 Tax=Eschrichtius robustus TaxID=9764 RepID=A0AB34G9J8_ESCRO|nr:hypothetical protein J1605_016110 [Eschrichtius robustus]
MPCFRGWQEVQGQLWLEASLEEAAAAQVSGSASSRAALLSTSAAPYLVSASEPPAQHRAQQSHGQVLEEAELDPPGQYLPTLSSPGRTPA